ncbi:MAG: hypothetical protein P8L66_08855 [Rhodospirillaceae bacterium]|nr:hypothetical protein [Rhodospirillaceae bacterium]
MAQDLAFMCQVRSRAARHGLAGFMAVAVTVAVMARVTVRIMAEVRNGIIIATPTLAMASSLIAEVAIIDHRVLMVVDMVEDTAANATPTPT